MIRKPGIICRRRGTLGRWGMMEDIGMKALCNDTAHAIENVVRSSLLCMLTKQLI